MKIYLTYAVAALFASSLSVFAAPDTTTLESKENAAWQAFKDKKADDFKKVVSPVMIGVYADGIADMNKEMSDMQKWDMKSFAISNYKVTSAGADIAIATYTVKVAGTYGGKDASATYNAGSVWKQQGADWQAIFHTNVIAEPAAK